MASTNSAPTVERRKDPEIVGIDLPSSEADIVPPKEVERLASVEDVAKTSVPEEHHMLDEREQNNESAQSSEPTNNSDSILRVISPEKKQGPEGEDMPAVAATPRRVEDVAGDDAEGELSDTTARATSPTATSFLATTIKASGSGSSSGSGSTIRQTSFTRRKSLDRENGWQNRDSKKSPPRKRSVPDALSFLEPDSPAVTPEAIQRSIETAVRRRSSGGSHRMSPSARSSTSSGSSLHSDVFSVGDLETDRSSSPEQSVNGDYGAASQTRTEPTGQGEKRRSRNAKSYGTPEMPRGNANLPHIPPNALQPRLPQYAGHIKHLPRAEKLPLSGYELVASKLSPGPSGQPTIQPMYRRFENLNHRVLLHLQDELAELEQQLIHLDTLDTQTRRSLNGIIPASRRKEYLAPSELQWQRTDILGKIGYKLGQYNHVLTSFKETQGLSPPSLSDVSDYRSYLATHNPITEIETRFLDVVDDLVSMARPSSRDSDQTDYGSDGAPTPMPQHLGDSTGSVSTLPANPSESDKDSLLRKISNARPIAPVFEPTVAHVALAVAVSFLLPILTFSVIPSFVGRMIVVFLVALGVLGPLMQSRERLGVDAQDGVVLASIYGGVMAVVAAIFS